MKRYISFDFTRAVAIVIIVSCHFILFGGCGYNPHLGRFLAEMGNTMFFGISALLFGLQYEKKGKSAFEPKSFLNKRLSRIFASLWPYLVFVLSALCLLGVSFNPAKVVMNFVGLGWFAKLPNLGHLWFVTMIIICYVMYIIASNTLYFSRLNRGGGGQYC